MNDVDLSRFMVDNCIMLCPAIPNGVTTDCWEPVTNNDALHCQLFQRHVENWNIPLIEKYSRMKAEICTICSVFCSIVCAQWSVGQKIVERLWSEKYFVSTRFDLLRYCPYCGKMSHSIHWRISSQNFFVQDMDKQKHKDDKKLLLYDP